ncbi:MAG: hypothetical protein R2780_01145 [Crocinitomicaceae bacterium]|nr:hypothetical protein [Crocinitomicaceae bacterium]
MNTTSSIIETDVSRIEINDRGFLQITLMDTGKSFDVAEANRQIAAAYELTGGRNYKVLVDTTQSSLSPSSEVKKAIADVEHKIKEAILVNSLGNRILGNIYLKIINRRYPSKIFTDREAAIQWLLEVE